MKKLLIILLVLGGLFLVPLSASAHCDAVDGPVATAALKALDTRNVNLILPFAPAEAEPELTAAFEQALIVRGKGPEARWATGTSWRRRSGCTGPGRRRLTRV